MTRSFSHKARIASQAFCKMQPALPRVPPRPFKPFARLADPLDDDNIDYLADKFHSLSMDGSLLSLPANTAHIATPAPTPVYDHNGSTSVHNTADLLFTGNGSAESPFIEVPQEPACSTTADPQQDYRLWEQEIYPLPEIISEHNPLILRAACWEDLHLVAEEHGFELDQYFKLTPKLKERSTRPSTELSAICGGDRYSCPHPCYSPDRRTLGPEYCADRLFFDRCYRCDNVDRRNPGHVTTKEDIRQVFSEIIE